MSYHHKKGIHPWLVMQMLLCLAGLAAQLAAVIFSNWLHVGCDTAIDEGSKWPLSLWRYRQLECLKNCSSMPGTVDDVENEFPKVRECFDNCTSSVEESNTEPAWLRATRLFQSMGCVACGVTLVLIYLYTRVSPQLAKEATSGLTAACLGSAAFMLIGLLTLAEGCATLTAEREEGSALGCPSPQADFGVGVQLCLTASFLMGACAITSFLVGTVCYNKRMMRLWQEEEERRRLEAISMEDTVPSRPRKTGRRRRRHHQQYPLTRRR